MNFLEPSTEALEKKLEELDPDLEPEWGTMTPQHMVEHLILSVRMSRGSKKFELETPEEKVDKLQAFLFSDQPMPKEFKSSFMPEGLADLEYPDLESAKKDLLKELSKYEEEYRDDPEKKETHPVFGTLDKKGWDQVHRKHFTHHLQQFGLILD